MKHEKRRPTIEQIREAFPELTPEKAAELHELMLRDESQFALETLNEHGNLGASLRVIRGDSWNNYYTDIVFLSLDCDDKGERPTLCYDVNKDRYFIGTAKEWLETNAEQYRIRSNLDQRSPWRRATAPA
ncbi:MAG TPA: hypothetical protein VEI97_17820 [bacterium]|nr:hypothetical protein [bacterium]